MHGEYKTHGGKLVIVDFDIVDGRLADVVVSGDFFLEPPEALAEIISALNGLPATSDQLGITDAIRSSIDDDVAMIGFTPESIAIAISRGRET